MRRFKLAEQVIAETAPYLQHALADAYRTRIRPLCLCKEGGLPMYIARVGDQYMVKRMPLSGSEHDPACPSYDPPAALSGLGVLMGSAIQVDPESGMSALKVGFSLTKIGPRAAPSAGTCGTDSTAGDTKKLSLRSLLHYLWHQAELTVWTSRWAGKRHWWNIRWHLMEAAERMIVKGGTLSEVLFVPEPFRATDKAAIEQRRAAALRPAFPPKSGPRKLMILVGEVKDLAPSRSRHRLIMKHMPNFPFIIDDTLHRRLQSRFERELSLHAVDDNSHLVAVATFGMNTAGLAIVEEAALMVVSENWIPYESFQEKMLLDALARMHEKSVKGLRYNLPDNEPIANAMLYSRTGPVALYIVPAGSADASESLLSEMIDSRPEIGTWIWRVGDGEMPSLRF